MSNLSEVADVYVPTEADHLIMWVHKTEVAACTFDDLAEKLREIRGRTRSPSTLRREVNQVLPVQAGRLLCECFDRGAVLFYPSRANEWDFRTFSPTHLRERALRFAQRGLEDTALEAFKLADELADECPDFPLEAAYLMSWAAFIRWRLATLHENRFRPDWNEQFAPWVDRVRAKLGASDETGEQSPNTTIFSPVIEETLLWRCDVSAEVQETACKIVAEELRREVSIADGRLKELLQDPTAGMGAVVEADSQKADDAVKGITIFDLAFLIEEDEKAAKNHVKVWIDNGRINAAPIGKCPMDGRRKLYRLSELLSDVGIILSLSSTEISKYRQALASKLRHPRDD